MAELGGRFDDIFTSFATRNDLPFLQEMLYQAVYWRTISQGTNPPFDEGMAAAGVSTALQSWGERPGDTGVVANVGSTPAGAAWYRFHTQSNAVRGYIDDSTPVVVIAVVAEYRNQGVGTLLLEWLIREASRQKIGRLSLMVSNDNDAFHLYRKLGFQDHAIVDDSRLMVRNL